MTSADVKKLDEKAQFLHVGGTFHYLLVSQSGFREECVQYMREKKVTFLTLKDVSALFQAV